MTGKSETVAMLKAIKRQMISDGVIRIEEMHFGWMKVTIPQSLKANWRVDGTWIDPKLLIAGRKEEMEYIVKNGSVRGCR